MSGPTKLQTCVSSVFSQAFAGFGACETPGNRTYILLLIQGFVLFFVPFGVGGGVFLFYASYVCLSLPSGRLEFPSFLLRDCIYLGDAHRNKVKFPRRDADRVQYEAFRLRIFDS